MSVANHILASMQCGTLSRSCYTTFPHREDFLIIFWNVYWPGYKSVSPYANYNDYIPALDILVEQGYLTASDGWYS